MISEPTTWAHAFSDAQAVAQYADGPPRMVPGFDGLHRMTSLLLAERARENAHVLVLGAGGGLELQTFARAQPNWTFEGVDPSAEMLQLAARSLADFAPRIHLRKGYIGDASVGPFDAATCLLTLHFVNRAQRRHTVAEVHRRLRPGAPFVVAHLSIPAGEAERDRWLARYVAFAVSSGVETEKAEFARSFICSTLSILPPDDDEAVLREAGFTDVSLFYVGFAFRGWVAYA